MSRLKDSLGIQAEVAYAKSIASLDFMSMDGNIECPNCGAKMGVHGCPDEEYIDRGFVSIDEYQCPECGLLARITQHYAQTFKKAEFDTSEMFEEEE